MKGIENRQNVWYKKLSEPETNNLDKGLRQVKGHARNDSLVQSCWLPG